jgi:pimeloyl-ACP methyl ester carboxylesterase
MEPEAWERDGKCFEHRGERIFYRDDGAGEVVLAIHGFPTSSWDWHKIWPGLTASYRVVAPDLIGFGLSAKPRAYPYSLFDQADLVEGVLKVLGITRAHVLAHDYGDTVAQELIARNAEGRLSFEMPSVCLLNGGIIPGMHRPVLMQRLLHSPLGRFIGPMMSERALRRNFLRIFGPNTQPDSEELRGYWHFIAHNGGPRVVHRLIKYMTERRQNYDRWVGALRAPGVPLRLIFGEVDPISGRHMADAFRALNPAPDVVDLPGIGHYPQCEAPGAVLNHYTAFLESKAVRG